VAQARRADTANCTIWVLLCCPTTVLLRAVVTCPSNIPHINLHRAGTAWIPQQVTAAAADYPYNPQQPSFNPSSFGGPDSTGKLGEAAKSSLSKATQAMSRYGWIGFWVQLTLSVVSGVILLFSVAFTSQVGACLEVVEEAACWHACRSICLQEGCRPCLAGWIAAVHTLFWAAGTWGAVCVSMLAVAACMHLAGNAAVPAQMAVSSSRSHQNTFCKNLDAPPCISLCGLPYRLNLGCATK
jgi:hypothetical protein